MPLQLIIVAIRKAPHKRGFQNYSLVLLFLEGYQFLLTLFGKINKDPFLFNKFLSTSLSPKDNDSNWNSNEDFHLIYTSAGTSNGDKMETFHSGTVRLQLVGINCLHLFPSMFLTS